MNVSLLFFLKLWDYLQDVIFHQEGALLLFALPMHQYLNEKVGSYWIGRGGTVAYLPHSPDLIPCEFFLRSYIKNRVFTILRSLLTS